MANYTFLKEKNKITINGVADEFPEDYYVSTDGEKRLLITSETGKRYEILITDTITINGEVFSGTLTELKQTLYNEVFYTQGPDIADDYANDAAAEEGGIVIGGMYHTSGAVKIRLV